MATVVGMAMTLRLSDEQTAALKDEAERTGRSMQQAALLAIDEWLKRQRHQDRVSSIARRLAAEQAETLRRLGD